MVARPTSLVFLLFTLQNGVSQTDVSCILGNWYDKGSVPNAQLMFHIQQSSENALMALALTPNPQWATGAVIYNTNSRGIIIQLDSNDTIKGTVSTDCSEVSWSVPNGAVWIKTPGVDNVHVVFMNHLDVGYARFIGDIINEYFDIYFPRAIQLATAAETWKNGTNGFIYTTHPWLVSLYLDCPPNLVFNGIPVHCPNKDALSAFETSVAKGHIAWHAGPMNMQVEFLDNVLWSTGLSIAESLGTRFNKPSSTVLSQRDVPGMTVAAIPVFVKHGIKGVSVGVNPGSAPPAVPKIFSWQFGGESVVALWHPGGYPLNPGSDLQNAGGISIRDCTVAPGTSHALCFAFRTDNTGPPTSLEELDKYYDILREEFPKANIYASTLDNFLDNVDVKSLTAVTNEIGDNWIQGIASDPQKCSTYRAAAKGLSECVQNGDCNSKDPIVFNATRFLIKLPEHTWGLPGIHDTVNWSNDQFQKARNVQGTYKDNENSWKEQRTFLDLALDACQGHKLSDYMLQNLADTKPVTPDLGEYKKINTSAPLTLMDGKMTIGFNSSIGSINQLVYHISSTETLQLATADNQLGVFTYHSYNESDYQFMDSHYHYYGNAGYDKPNSTSVHPESRMWPVTLLKTYQSTRVESLFLVQLGMANKTAHDFYGAPQEVWINIELTAASSPQSQAIPMIRLDYDMIIMNKNPTRLPEATFFSFFPNPPTSSSKWTGYLSKVGNDGSTEVSVGSVVKNGSQYQHAVQYAKLASDQLLAAGGYSVKMNSTHIPLVCPITGDGWTPTPFPAPLDPIPDGKVIGMAFNIHNNVWNTNYPLYYPYASEDANFKSKFTVGFYG